MWLERGEAEKTVPWLKALIWFKSVHGVFIVLISASLKLGIWARGILWGQLQVTVKVLRGLFGFVWFVHTVIQPDKQ